LLRENSVSLPTVIVQNTDNEDINNGLHSRYSGSLQTFPHSRGSNDSLDIDVPAFDDDQSVHLSNTHNPLHASSTHNAMHRELSNAHNAIESGLPNNHNAVQTSSTHNAIDLGLTNTHNATEPGLTHTHNATEPGLTNTHNALQTGSSVTHNASNNTFHENCTDTLPSNTTLNVSDDSYDLQCTSRAYSSEIGHTSRDHSIVIDGQMSIAGPETVV
jgi:hypothetical protein